ncbi:MAG: hypothetical protein IT373_00860 [Polyangiaceae bacterium]|nr:hypothetical protein [Polyangiaceae bacterium]
MAALCCAALGAVSAGACGRTGPWDFDDEGYGAGGPGGHGTGAPGAGGQGAGGTGLGGSGAGGLVGGGGSGGACVLDVDCEDGDSCTTDRCAGGLCSHFMRDDDEDGHVAEACLGDDCNDLNPNAYPGHPELCSDGSDNDCNGVEDCFDPVCVGNPTCGCVPAPGGESCTNGVDDDCDEAVDCLDTNCQGTPACGCAASETGHCDNGLDEDCDDQIDCADSNCFSDPACQCVGAVESCSNGIDDDCDLLVDCADSNCWGMFPCACIPPGTPEVCNNGSDEDCDGDVDCADTDCNSSPACTQCEAENCTDGLDNNCNGAIDCADVECWFDPACAPEPELCNNGLDDDNDGKIDCQDPDCASNPVCVLAQANCLSPKLIPGTGTFTGDTTGHVNQNHGTCGGAAGEAVFYFVLNAPSRVHLDSVGTSFDSTLYVRKGSCDHGKEIGCDDDSGGSEWAAALDFLILYPGVYYVFLDGFTVDPNMGANEGPFQLHVEIVPNPPELCQNGLDDDGDHYVDCADTDCTSAPGCLNCNQGAPPTAEFGVAVCTNGRDDDCDGVSDCADPDCHASDYYVTECCDGTDQNGNQIIDDFACRCASDSDCPGDEICYTHTVFACGYRCDQFFGQICPYVAPGSYCNASTGQCEF